MLRELLLRDRNWVSQSLTLREYHCYRCYWKLALVYIRVSLKFEQSGE